MMKPYLMAAALAATTLVAAVPAQAQNYPFEPGGLMEVTEITIEDGGDFAYADFLAKTWRKNQEFAKSQGWITDYRVWSNVFKRDGEPDLFLVVTYPDMPDAAESTRRREAFRAFMKQTDAELAAASGARAKIRHVGGTMLLSEMRFK